MIAIRDFLGCFPSLMMKISESWMCFSWEEWFLVHSWVVMMALVCKPGDVIFLRLKFLLFLMCDDDSDFLPWRSCIQERWFVLKALFLLKQEVLGCFLVYDEFDNAFWMGLGCNVGILVCS